MYTDFAGNKMIIKYCYVFTDLGKMNSPQSFFMKTE